MFNEPVLELERVAPKQILGLFRRDRDAGHVEIFAFLHVVAIMECIGNQFGGKYGDVATDPFSP